MLRTHAILLLVVIALIFIGATAHAGTVISGKIFQKDLANRTSPLSGCYIDILSLDRLHILASTITSSSGSFAISATTWEDKTYVIRASKRGYLSYEGASTLKGGSPMPFTATLQFDPYNPPPEIFDDPTTSSRKSDWRAYSPDGTRYAKSVRQNSQYSVTVYRVSDDQPICQLYWFPNSTWTGNDPKALAWSRDGSSLAVMFHGNWSTDSAIHLYNASTGVLLRDIVSESLPFHQYMVFGADNTVIFCVNSDRVTAYYPSGFGTTMSFFKNTSGFNLPWENYGWDLGVQPWGGAHGGFSSNLVKTEADFALMSAHGAKTVRIWLFADLRTGLTYDGSGNPTGFDQYVYADMDALIAIAEKYHIKLILVLFDYKIADGVEYEGATKVGEHPEFFTDPGKFNALRSYIGMFVNHYKDRQCIYAWEVMNEPEYAGTAVVTQADAQSFVTNMANTVSQWAGSAMVTIGNKDRGSMVVWPSVNITPRQFHYYDNMESTFPFNYPASSLGIKYPVIIGEVQPSSLTSKLDNAYANGYAGVLFWSLNANYTIPLDEYLAWVTSH